MKPVEEGTPTSRWEVFATAFLSIAVLAIATAAALSGR